MEEDTIRTRRLNGKRLVLGMHVNPFSNVALIKSLGVNEGRP